MSRFVWHFCGFSFRARHSDLVLWTAPQRVDGRRYWDSSVWDGDTRLWRDKTSNDPRAASNPNPPTPPPVAPMAPSNGAPYEPGSVRATEPKETP